MKALATAAVVLCVLTASNGEAPPNEQPPRDDNEAKTKRLLAEIICVNKGDRQGTRSDNSQVIIETPAIEKVVQGGFDNLELLLLAMKDESICFDSFIRCYSACDQILRKIDPELCVYWQGGSEPQEFEGVWRFLPRGNQDDISFRRKVVKDAEAKRTIALKKLKEKSDGK